MKMSVQENNEEEAQDILELLNPQRGNLVLSFLLDRLHLGLLGVVVTTFVALSLFNILLNMLQGTLWPTSDPDFIALWDFRFLTHWTSVPFLYPTLAGIAVVVYRRIPLMFRELIDSGVLVVPSYKRYFFANLQKRYQSQVVNLAIIISLVAFSIGWGVVTLRQGSANWIHKVPNHVTIAGWYWIFMGSVAIYVVLHLTFSIFVTFQAIHTVFIGKSGFKISLKFMHPDCCCGLRPLNKFVLKIGLFLALLGLANGIHIVSSISRYPTTGELLQQIGPFFCIVGYILFAPLAFFLPLLPAHRVMRNGKHTFQMHISHEFHRRFGHLSNRVARGQLDGSEHSQLEVLSSCQRYVDAFPVWPFNVGMLVRFAAMVLLPLMLTVLGMLLQKLFL